MGSDSGRSTPETTEFELVVHERRQQRRVRVGPTATVLIGRGIECQITVENASVSRRHARLKLSEPRFVEDLHSKNGTFVFASQGDVETGQGLHAPPGEQVPVTLGTVVKLGTVLIGIERATSASRTEPMPSRPGPAVLEDGEMRRIYSLADRAAETTLPVLILGETGVGKDVLAEHIHRSSSRALGAFVRVNCGALSPSLLESELFGHERGAFTNASGTKVGLLELAAGGTAFLDEIGELPMAMQVKLLHVLETGELTKVGGTRPKHVDLRIVAATNRELGREVQAGRFRKDLYFRLNSICLQVPPLRRRKDEIVPLARLFLERFCTQAGLAMPELPAETLRHLLDYSWPGNARELRNAMERAPLLAGGGPLLPDHLRLDGELERENTAVQTMGDLRRPPESRRSK
jgi:two-component system, NtrC family, response regulator AtoC